MVGALALTAELLYILLEDNVNGMRGQVGDIAANESVLACMVSYSAFVRKVVVKEKGCMTVSSTIWVF